ncbi:MAG: hypothetical protein AB7J13_06575 [Pyrinomonadaceae bacterium]
MVETVSLTIQHIREAFPLTAPPMPDWENCRGVADFVERFGDEFFLEFWPYMLDDLDISAFLLPFLMEYFLITPMNEEDKSTAAYHFVRQLDPVLQIEVQKDLALQQFYDKFDGAQKSAICGWLNLLEKALILEIETTKKYWCRKVEV